LKFADEDAGIEDKYCEFWEADGGGIENGANDEDLGPRNEFFWRLFFDRYHMMTDSRDIECDCTNEKNVSLDGLLPNVGRHNLLSEVTSRPRQRKSAGIINQSSTPSGLFPTYLERNRRNTKMISNMIKATATSLRVSPE